MVLVTFGPSTLAVIVSIASGMLCFVVVECSVVDVCDELVIGDLVVLCILIVVVDGDVDDSDGDDDDGDKDDDDDEDDEISCISARLSCSPFTPRVIFRKKLPIVFKAPSVCEILLNVDCDNRRACSCSFCRRRRTFGSG